MKNPIKYSLATEIWPIFILLMTLGLSYWSYLRLPAQVITHWNFYGQANGWSSREFHVIFFPAILMAMYALFNLMPKFDPHRERYQEFTGVYQKIRNLILLTLFIVFVAATLVNLGYALNIGVIVTSTIGLMMIILGNYFDQLKRNSFIGIRTPWTLLSDNVWDKTHHLGGRLFMLWGLGLIIAPWLTPPAAFAILLGGIVVIVIWLSVYSYLLYKQEKNNKNLVL